MYLYDYEKSSYHGGTLRVIAKKKNNFLNQNFNKINKAIQTEEKFGLFKKKIYINITKRLENKKKILLKKITNYKKKNFKIVGIGAAAKANTFLCYFNLNNKIIDFVTDASKFKIGKYTPKTRIPIYSDDILKKKNVKVVAIILSWNISELIKTKLRKFNKNLKFIKL